MCFGSPGLIFHECMKSTKGFLPILVVIVFQTIVAERPADDVDQDSILQGDRTMPNRNGAALARRPGWRQGHSSKNNLGTVNVRSNVANREYRYEHPVTALLQGRTAEDFSGALAAGNRRGIVHQQLGEHQNSSEEMLQSGKGERHQSDSHDPDQKEKEAEEKAEKAESSKGFGSAIGSLAGALTDPVGFLRGLEPVKAVESALKLALNAQSGDKAGKCLADGSKLEGLGCSDKHGAQMCGCYRTAEQCYVPDNPNEVAQVYMKNQEQGLEEIMALMYGRCYRPIWFWILLALVPIVLLIIFFVVKRSLRGGRKDDSDSD
eukprot:TRINITY_DN92191_c0_g1_i1.p1 TRINITY_DN92191_c0_g1~~TRINITY_DN92191_c0_g1_i1.p1  ORF type:complete len:320 (-),score=61.06 TRINITY_DN92191_c0_g1_i1:106-1065(-)